MFFCFIDYLGLVPFTCFVIILTIKLKYLKICNFMSTRYKLPLNTTVMYLVSVNENFKKYKNSLHFI